jgi:hypothetical protein
VRRGPILGPRLREASDQESSHEADEDPSISRDLGLGRRADRLLPVQKEGTGLPSPGANVSSAHGELPMPTWWDALLAHARHDGAGRHRSDVRGACVLIALGLTAGPSLAQTTGRDDVPLAP